jgi:hypothetical protein
MPGGGRAPDADQWVHVFLAVSLRRLPGTSHPRLQTLLTAISTGMRLSPVTVTVVPSDTARAWIRTGNAEELIAAIGHRFHRDYDVVLRAMLFAVDRHRARQISGPAFLGRVP